MKHVVQYDAIEAFWKDCTVLGSVFRQKVCLLCFPVLCNTIGNSITSIYDRGAKIVLAVDLPAVLYMFVTMSLRVIYIYICIYQI